MNVVGTEPASGGMFTLRTLSTKDCVSNRPLESVARSEIEYGEPARIGVGQTTRPVVGLMVSPAGPMSIE